MTRKLLTVLSLLLAGQALASAPPAVVAAAVADAQRLGEDARHALYLHFPYTAAQARTFPRASAHARRVRDFPKVLTYAVNSVSRQAKFGRPVLVCEGLFRVDVRDYGWDRKVLDRLAALHPYYNTQLTVLKEEVALEDEEWAGGVDGRDGKYYPPGKYKIERVKKVPVKSKDSFFIPTAPAADLAALSALTGSAAPLLRADWFVAQTARQVDRNNVATGAGYYDFLGVKDENDLFALRGIDKAKAQRARREIAAIIDKSGVNVVGTRQVYWLDTGYVETHDPDRAVRESNAKRQLNGDFKFVALEVYFRLPNNLWGLAAVKEDDRTLQNTVPPQIANDKESTSNDLQIHPQLSCVRCHVEGLRPLNDWARQFYRVRPAGQPQNRLQSPDKEKLLRLEQLYLNPMLETYYKADQLIYTDSLNALVGWSPKELAEAYAREWWLYADAEVSGVQLAAELGTPLPEMKKAFTAVQTATGFLDPVLAGYLLEPEGRSIRTHVEEVFPAALLYLSGKVAP